MGKKKIEKEREIIEISSEETVKLWDELYFEGSTAEYNGETYKHITKINTSDYSDGPSWDYIIERQSDGKFFKFNIWESSHGYSSSDECLEEVFKVQTVTYE